MSQGRTEAARYRRQVLARYGATRGKMPPWQQPETWRLGEQWHAEYSEAFCGDADPAPAALIH